MLSIIAEERARRDAEESELRAVLGRLLESGAGKFVNCSQVRRILVMCGSKATVAQVTVAIRELFPATKVVRRQVGDDLNARAYEGVSIKRGFSVAKVAKVIEKRYGGVFSDWEEQMVDEGMPADVADISDPANLTNSPGAVKNRGITRVGIYHDDLGGAYGRGERQGDAGETVREGGTEPFGAELAGNRYAFLSRAFQIPGFFDSKHTAAYFGDPRDRVQAWRLYCQGERPYVIARLLGRSPGGIKRVLQRLEKRLRAHLRHAADFDEMPDGKLRRPLRYLYANRWENYQERRLWEMHVLQRARKEEIARELELPQSEVVRLLHKHKARAKMQLDRSV
jgi:hypothetical protein